MFFGSSWTQSTDLRFGYESISARIASAGSGESNSTRAIAVFVAFA